MSTTDVIQWIYGCTDVVITRCAFELQTTVFQHDSVSPKLGTSLDVPSNTLWLPWNYDVSIINTFYNYSITIFIKTRDGRKQLHHVRRIIFPVFEQLEISHDQYRWGTLSTATTIATPTAATSLSRNRITITIGAEIGTIRTHRYDAHSTTSERRRRVSELVSSRRLQCLWAR